MIANHLRHLRKDVGRSQAMLELLKSQTGSPSSHIARHRNRLQLWVLTAQAFGVRSHLVLHESANAPGEDVTDATTTLLAARGFHVEALLTIGDQIEGTLPHDCCVIERLAGSDHSLSHLVV